MKEGPRVYVERIDITGNVRTLDKVIRREFRLVEGDAFNTTKMQRSEQRIKNLGFFKKVDVTNSAGLARPTRRSSTSRCEEQSTGEFSVGVGFSTTDGPLADIGIHERNFLGRGQDLRIGTVVVASARSRSTSASPSPISSTRTSPPASTCSRSRPARHQFLQRGYPGLQQFSYGGALRAGYQITEQLRQTLKYTLRSDRITERPERRLAVYPAAGRART